jgi:putative ABC transport system permease protein
MSATTSKSRNIFSRIADAIIGVALRALASEKSPLTVKIAARNIERHRGKSLIIGIILFLGAFIMTLGFGVIQGMDRGLQKNVVNCFTGHSIIIPDKQENDNVFFEFMGRSVEPIYNYPAIRTVLEKQPYVDRFLPMGKNVAMILNDEGGTPGMAMLLGVEFAKYRKMFGDNTKVIEGRLPAPGERGVLVPTGARKEFYDFTGIWFTAEGTKKLDTALLEGDAKKDAKNLIVKTSAVGMGLSEDNATTDVRMDIKGIVKYRSLNRIWGHFVLADIESYRQCLGYFTTTDRVAAVPEAKKSLLSMEDNSLDNLFSADQMVVENKVTHNAPMEHITRDTTQMSSAAAIDPETGAYNLVSVMFKPGVKLDDGIRQLNAALKQAGCGVRAVSWKKSIGILGNTAIIIEAVLMVFVVFLFFVAIIIIINTLSMAAIERTSEIGMMRAVGAQKGFIRTMFLGETGLLSAVFGGAGIVAGILTVSVVTVCRITSDNDFVQLLFGGDTFRPLLSVPGIGLAVLGLVLVTVIAVIYPIIVASNITPLDSISRE